MPDPLSTPRHSRFEAFAQSLFDALDGHIVMGIPIGIGKPTELINAIYALARKNPDYRLDIHTALSLSRPVLKSELEKRLLTPFLDRQFAGVPELDYVLDGRKQSIPDNIRIVEFYFKPGEMLHNPKAQQNALSANYTHVARDMMTRQVNLVTQMISKKVAGEATRYSLSSNPDVTLDLQRMMREHSQSDGKTRLLIAQVNENMPFMPNDAEVPAEFFDEILDDPEDYSALFCTPHQPISQTDHMIGFYSSALLQDGGTLQIGIGSLGDAVVNSLLIRQHKNGDYYQLLKDTGALDHFPVLTTDGAHNTFTEGLYGNTEMLVPGYMELIKGDILTRRVYDDVDIQQLINSGLAPAPITFDWLQALHKRGRIQTRLTESDVHWLQHWGLLSDQITLDGDQLTDHDGHRCHASFDDPHFKPWAEQYALGQKLRHARRMHAGFFVGNEHFYDDLKALPEQQLSEFNMTSVMFTNQLQGDEPLKLAQRKKARFINACMKVTLSGAAVSDGLADGSVISGVGGQFNFVNMAHEIPDARSILMMRACRNKGNKTVSNIVFNYGHTTVPRHMRDIVITEYGIADLRGRNDQEIIDQLLKVCDSRFQAGLIRQAQKAGKLPNDYRLPGWARNNTPEAVANLLKGQRAQDFQPFPFGKELTDQEVLIGAALKRLKHKLTAVWPLIPALIRPLSNAKLKAHSSHLERMQLAHPVSVKERLYRRLLLSELPDSAAASESQADPAKSA